MRISKQGDILLTELNLRNHCCCFTGHRPEKLNLPEFMVHYILDQKIREAIDDGYQTFITGMARGPDIWAAELVLKYRAFGNPIRLVCAVPYKGVETRWSTEWQERYRLVLRCANEVKFICRRYSPDCFQIRNKWMVDHSDRLIAVYNGSSGGTQNTMNYAILQGLSVVFVHPHIEGYL